MLDQVLAKHYTNYKNQSVENIKRDAKGLLHIISDYEGRVVFELLQNAFDRADEKIAILIKDNILYVANDGKKFSYIKDFDYEKGQNDHRGDFQSICSVYTSTKTVSNSIGNKGIGFKSVFSIAKNQDQVAVQYPTRYVEIYTKGLFIEKDSKPHEAECGFRLFEIIRSGHWLARIADKVNVEELSSNITNAQKEYAETGLPGYYFPIEISIKQNTIQELFKVNYVTVVAIPLENKEKTESLIRNNLVENGIHFQFIQLKYPKPFEVTLSIDDEQLASKVVDPKDINLIHQNIDNQELKDLAIKAGIEIEVVSIGIYLREDNKGKLYNYLPTDVNSPFPFVDFHADFRTTLNRKHINWEGAVGDYNKALLRACIELLFTIWHSQEIDLNTKYIKDFRNAKVPEWNINYFEPSFDIESIETKTIISLFKIKDGRWDSDFGNFTNWLAYNINSYTSNYINEDYQLLYDIIIKLCYAITNDYNLRVWSRVDGFMNNLKSSFERYDVTILPNLTLKNNQEIFYTKDEDAASSFLPIYFTSIEFTNDKLNKVLNVKKYTDLNEIFKHFKQCNYFEYLIDENPITTEEQQIEILQFVYELFCRKNDREVNFSDRYATVFTAESRVKNSPKNQANFNLSTLFLKTKDNKYKPAQLCSLNELDDAFRAKLNFSNTFYYFMGVSPHPDIKVFDVRIYNKFNEGVSSIPKLIHFDGAKDPINKDIVYNCRISKDQLSCHPALINDNYPNLFPEFKKGYMKTIRSVVENLAVKKYEQFSSDYFSILLDYLSPYFKEKSFYQDIKSFYAYTFHLFHRNNKWLIYNGKEIDVVSQKTFVILKTKVDLDIAYQQSLSNFLVYEADKGLYEDKELENCILELKESVSFDQETKKDITIKINEVLENKLVYILYDITNDKQSDRDYLENDYSILDNVKNTKFYVVKNFKINRASNFLKYDYNDKFKIEGNQIYMADKSEKTISLVLSNWLFDTNRYAEKLEIIFYHRDTNELLIESNLNEINLFKQKYDTTFQLKEELFLKEISKVFPEIQIQEPNWNFEGSISLNEIDENGRREELVAFIEDLKFSDAFKEFDFSYRIISLNGDGNILDINNDKVVKDSEVDYLIRKISNNINTKSLVSSMENDDSIVENSNFSPKKKKIVNFHGEKVTNENLEFIGTNGEHEVLQYYVHNFFALNTAEKKDIVIKVFNLIKDIVQDVSYFENLKDKILLNVDANDVMESIIPFLYITSKYKYSYFDMIGFNAGSAFPVEVKTSSIRNRSDFYISSAEIECALRFPNYQIVRVTPEDITFLGNPILSFKNQLQGFQNNSYKLISTKYKIELLK